MFKAGILLPRWESFAKMKSIERATNLIKEHGSNVEFLVIKDKQFWHRNSKANRKHR